MSVPMAAEQATRGLIVSGGRQEFESRIAQGLGVLPADSPAEADLVICDLDQAAFEVARRDALAAGKPLCLVIPGPLPLHSGRIPSSFSHVVLKATILTRYGNAFEAAIRALLAGALQAGRASDASMIGLWRTLPPGDGRSPRQQNADPEGRALQNLLETGRIPETEGNRFWHILAETCTASQLDPDRVVGPVLQKNTVWFEPYGQGVVAGPDALEILRLIETRWAENDLPVHGFAVEAEIRPLVSASFTGKGGPVAFHESEADALAAAAADGGVILSADRRITGDLEEACYDANIALLRADENFAGFAGLDPFLPPAALLAADDLGAHWDPSRQSRLEMLLQSYELSAEEVQRGTVLLEKLTGFQAASGGPEKERGPDLPQGRKVVLVPGQDPAHAATASRATDINLDLLRRVRERNPDAFIVFKPSPGWKKADRETGMSPREVRRYADLIADRAGIPDLIGRCDALETFSSPAGLAALLEGKPVAVHGLPFYAGWGLTEDLAACPRRTARRSLAELVYLILVVHARCTDPTSLLPCPPELLIDRAAARRQEIRRPVRKSLLNPRSWFGRKPGL